LLSLSEREDLSGVGEGNGSLSRRVEGGEEEDEEGCERERERESDQVGECRETTGSTSTPTDFVLPFSSTRRVPFTSSSLHHHSNKQRRENSPIRPIFSDPASSGVALGIRKHKPAANKLQAI